MQYNNNKTTASETSRLFPAVFLFQGVYHALDGLQRVPIHRYVKIGS